MAELYYGAYTLSLHLELFVLLFPQPTLSHPSGFSVSFLREAYLTTHHLLSSDRGSHRILDFSFVVLIMLSIVYLVICNDLFRIHFPCQPMSIFLVYC